MTDGDIKRLNKLVVDCQSKKGVGKDYSRELREIFLIVGDLWPVGRIESIISDYMPAFKGFKTKSRNLNSMAQDIRQDILVKVYEQGVWAYKPETANFSTYLYRMVYNSVIDVARRLAVENRLFRQPSGDETEDTDLNDLLHGGRAERLIDLLPSKTYRDILRRHYLEREKLSDIGRDLKIGNALAGIYRRRALEELRQLVNESKTEES